MTKKAGRAALNVWIERGGECERRGEEEGDGDRVSRRPSQTARGRGTHEPSIRRQLRPVMAALVGSGTCRSEGEYQRESEAEDEERKRGDAPCRTRATRRFRA